MTKKLIIVGILSAILAYSQVKETIIKVEIDNAQVKDANALKRSITAQTTIKINKTTTAQLDTIELSIPVEPTFDNTEYYKVKMIIETPAADSPTTSDTTLSIPIKGL